ncbi:MAG: hypothetical protein ACO3A4_10125 [Silvanigrellaceae bacterium]
MWKALVVDVMNPMGALVAQEVRECHSAQVYGSTRDAMFLAAWKLAIDPGTNLHAGFNSRMVLLESLERIVQIALELLDHPMNKSDDTFIGSLREPKTSVDRNISPPFEVPLEIKLREEVLYFFGSLTALGSKLPLIERIRSFEYLSAVVGQSDEFFPMTVGENLGAEMRSNFEFLTSLHHIQSNARQTGRIKRLCDVEQRLQDICCKATTLQYDKNQDAQITWELARVHKSDEQGAGVLFLPSASGGGLSPEEMRSATVRQLSAGRNKFLLVDSFHHRLRWMERLNRTRQRVIFSEIQQDPLRARSNFESRSGRTRIAVLSGKTLAFLSEIKASELFRSLPIAVQEIVDTALEIDEIRRIESWGEPPSFDFIDLVETLAVCGFEIKSGQVLQSLTKTGMPKFLDATLRQQSIDSQSCFRVLSE